ncbi:MAG: thermonuclease family protein [Acidimicrobiia bacterium]
MTRPRGVALVACILVAASLGGWRMGSGRRAVGPASTVQRVIDGDTIVVRRADGSLETVRLLGVDTPETHHPTKPVQCYGPEAAAFTRRRLTGRAVRFETDVETRDAYGRRLAYVLLDGERFNDVLLRAGYARLLIIPPNGVHAREMLREELDARRARRGLWGACEAS